MIRPLILLSLLSTSLLAACAPDDPAARLARMHLPAAGFVPDAAEGEQLFASGCASCHGAGARGSARGPSLLDPIYRPAHHANLAFHWAVRDGVRAHHWSFGDMPPQPQITPEAAAHIVAWVREQQRGTGVH